MNSAAFLHRGIAPLPASGISLNFYRPSPNGGAQSQKCTNNGLQIIRCAKTSNSLPSNSGQGGFPSPNAKMALQSLLCFSSDTAAELETQNISAEKKKALQALLAGNKGGEAERIMTKLQKKYQKAPATIKYDAKLAFVQILLHIGTRQSLDDARKHLNEIATMVQTQHLPSDAKPILYRAVMYTLLDNNREAQFYWNCYKEEIGSGPSKS